MTTLYSAVLLFVIVTFVGVCILGHKKHRQDDAKEGRDEK